MSMIRQCAWCLRLMNDDGERTTHHPVPKIYEATHGMCAVCGMLWMEQVMRDQESNMSEMAMLWRNDKARTTPYFGL